MEDQISFHNRFFSLPCNPIHNAWIHRIHCGGTEYLGYFSDKWRLYSKSWDIVCEQIQGNLKDVSTIGILFIVKEHIRYLVIRVHVVKCFFGRHHVHVQVGLCVYGWQHESGLVDARIWPVSWSAASQRF